MPKSLDEVYNSQQSKKKKDDDVGFFESALAGVATGLWNIPKGAFSLGATVFDLIGDTNTARDVEKWFDDVNPFDDEAEARTVGKITQAISQIAIPAGYGFKLGSTAAKAWQARTAADLAKKAIEAKRAHKYFSLARVGNLIAKTPTRAKLIGGVVGGGLGEAVVADEDIGTFGDIARGTSLEPFAITMMNKDENLKGREDALRRLVNRLKFGTEGALFNLALVGAGKGIQKLRKPKDSLEAYSKNRLKAFAQKYGEFGLTAKGAGPRAVFESKEAAKGMEKAVAVEATNLVNALEDNLKAVGDTFYEGYLKSKGAIRVGQTGQQRVLEDIQKIISPKSTEAERILDPALAKGRLKELDPVFQYKKLQKELVEVASSRSKNLDDTALENLLVDLRDKFKLLKQQHPNIENMVKQFDEKGIFTVDDLKVTKELDDLLGRVKESAGEEVADRLKRNIFDMRLAVDNMSGRLLQKQMPKEIADTIKANFGRYLNTTYRQYEQRGFFGLFKYKPTQEIIDRSEELFVESKLKSLGRQATPKELTRYKNQARETVEDYMRKMADDEIDPRMQVESNIDKEIINEVQVRDSIVRKSAVEPWQRELLGEIKDPSYTFFNTVGKQANLNATLSYMDDIAKIGAEGDDAFIIDPERIIQSRITKAKQDRLVGYSGPAFSELEDEILERQIRQKVSDELGFLDNSKWTLVKNATKVPTPLDGKYIKTPVYDSIFDTSSNWLNRSYAGQFYKTMVLAPKAGSQIAKTILSPLTHVRNALSAGAFVSANGAFFPNYGDWKLLNPFSSQSIYKQAYGISGKRVFGTMTKADSELYQKLLKVGVVDSQVQANETKRLFRDMFKDPAAVDRSLTTKVPQKVGMETKRKLLKGYAKLQDAYIAEDDFWKIINWNLERNRYQKLTKSIGVDENNFKAIIDSKTPQRLAETAEEFAARQAKSREAIASLGENGQKIADYFSELAQRRGYIESGIDNIQQYSNFLDEIAGNLTRNQVPNYGYVGRTARALRQSPFGNFIAFPLEIMRTGNNILTRSIDDIASGIPEIQQLGYKRLASFGATVVGVPAAVVGAAKSYHDVDDEEMDALRRIVPEWSKNSTLVPMGRDKNGYLKYIDFSYSNAYDSLTRPVMAVYRGLAQSGEDKESLAKGLGEGMLDSFSEILKPYATESIYTEALIDSTFRRGVGRGGRKIWSEEDDFGVKTFKGISHIAQSLAPGSLSQFKRLAEATSGVSDDYGRTFNLSDEIHGLYGMRVINSDPERALKYKVTSFGSNLKKDYNLFIAPLLRGGRVTPEQIIERYGYAEGRRFNTMREMFKDIEAMRKLGMKDFKIRGELRKRKGIKRDAIDQVLRGDYTPEYPSKFFIERIGEINRDLNRREGVTLPNPYFKALPYLTKIIRDNRRLDLRDDLFTLPEFDLPDYRGTLERRVDRLTSNIIPGGSPNASIIGSVNQASGTTIPYNQMTVAQKIEYDKAMRGI
jgi:ferritin-like metal-binding protein YciE